jgi:hypothetical protein
MINNDMDFNDALKNANYTTSYTGNFNSPKATVSQASYLSTQPQVSILDLEYFNRFGDFEDITSDWQQQSNKAVWSRDGGYLGGSVDNFIGINGLSCTNLYWYDRFETGVGGLVIELSYTSSDKKDNYRWIQRFSRNHGPWTLDNEGSGSAGYYSPSELARNINGNTISFSDRPRSYANNLNYRFVLSLYKGNDRIFAIFYGYELKNGYVSPFYPQVIVKP